MKIFSFTISFLIESLFILSFDCLSHHIPARIYYDLGATK